MLKGGGGCHITSTQLVLTAPTHTNLNVHKLLPNIYLVMPYNYKVISKRHCKCPIDANEIHSCHLVQPLNQNR